MSLLLFTSIVWRMYQCVMYGMLGVSNGSRVVVVTTNHRLSVFTLGDATDA